MIDALADAVERGARDPELRFVRIRAAGPAFCLGRDREGRTPDELRAEAGRIVRLNEALRATPLVVLCEMEGDAAGFGAGLVAAADVAVAAETARFWFPELEAGLAPVIVLSWLAELVPPKRAFELVATGRQFGAAEGVGYGLVSEVVAPGGAAGRVDEWVDELAARSGPALRDVKEFLSRTRGLPPAAAARAAVDALALGSLRLRPPG